MACLSPLLTLLENITLTVFLLLVFVIFHLCFWIRLAWRLKARIARVPGPRLARWSRLWIAKALASGRSHEIWNEVNSKFGPVARIGPNHVITDDPEITRRILTVRSGYVRGPWFDSVRIDPHVPNIVSERDPKRHGRIRAKLAPSFSGTSVAAMEPIIDQLVLGWLDTLRKRFATPDKIHCDIGQKIQFLTVDIITKICLGDEIGCVKNDRDMYRLIETVEVGNKACQYFSVFLELNMMLFQLARLPVLRRWIFPKPCDSTGVGRLMGIVHDVVSKREKEGATKEDVVSSLLRRGMPKEQIDSELIIALVAGSDTTSTSVQSTLLCIVTNPRVYDTLRSEIRRAVERGEISNPIQDTEAKQLVYLQACVLEGLRKFPPLSQLRERVIPAGGDTLGRFRLPEGTFVGLNAWGVQLNKAVYGDDADLYRPERWLTDDVDKVQAMYQTHSLIFGHGSTKCLGVSMAMVEITKVIFEESGSPGEQTDNESKGSEGTSNLQLSLLVASLFCGTFVMALDATIIGTAVPSITTDFNSLDDIAWYGSGYLLTITAFQPTLGKVYRYFNVKLVFMACILVFEVGSIICAAATSSAVFIIGRAIAGAGAAGLFQGALAIITKTVRLKNRPLCISIVTSTFAVSVCIGPVIGGALTQYVSWRWCFWINVPIGGVVLLLIFFIFHPPKAAHNKEFKSETLAQKLLKLDPLGCLFIISAVVCILLALQWGGHSEPWNSSRVIGLLIAFPIILGLFVWTQWKQGADATLPAWLLKQRSLLAAGLFSFFFAMPTYIYGYYIPIYFQAVKGAGATESGTQFLALAIPQIFGVVFSGALVTMLGVYLPFMIIGTAIGMIGSGLFLMLDLHTSTALWAVFLVVCGIGTGFAINLPYTIAQAVLTEDRVPTGNAALQFLFQFGSALSLSIGQTIFLNRLKATAHILTPTISESAIISAGAYNLRGLAGSEEIYHLLRQVYMSALHDTYVFPVVAAGVALLMTFAVEHKNIKKIDKEREEHTHSGKSSDGSGSPA